MLKVSESGGKGVGGRSKRRERCWRLVQAEEKVLEVSSSGGRGVGGKCKRRNKCWR